MSKTMPWFRFYSEALHDRKMAKAAQDAGVLRVVIIGAWVSVLSLASESPDRGKLLVTLQERFNETDIADELGVDETTVKKILSAFVKFEMLHIENGVYCVTNWENRQFDSDFSTERVRKHRAKQLCNVPVTPPEEDTDTDTESDKDTDKDTDKDKKREEPAAPTDPFDQLREAITAIGILPQTKADIDEITAMVKAGVTVADLKEGVSWKQQHSDGKPIRFVSQLSGPAKTAMQKRKQPFSGKGSIQTAEEIIMGVTLGN